MKHDMYISIVIPMYNSKYTIIKSIESVLNQSYQGDMEILIINDGSSDNCDEMVKNYISNNNSSISIRLINKRNGGVSSARNVGIKEAKGDWIALLDSDDIWVSKKLEKQVDEIKINQDIKFIGSNRDDDKYPFFKKSKKYIFTLNAKEIIAKWYPQTSTALIKREVLINAGLYDEERHYAEDVDLWLRIALICNLFVLNETLVYTGGGKQSFRGTGLSSNMKKMQKGEIAAIKKAKNRNQINFIEFMIFYFWIKFKYVTRIMRTVNHPSAMIKYDTHECPVCKNLGRRLVYRTRDRHYGIAGEWDVTECVECKLVQIYPMLTHDKLVKLYPENFYAYSKDKHQKKYKEIIKRLFFTTLVVKDPFFPAPGRVLDYGCGTGWSLLKFRDAGWSCVGIEPNENAAEVGQKNFGLDIKIGTICTVSPFENAFFDYIRLNHSIEHDPDAAKTIHEMRRIIKPDGKLLIGVPNINSITAKIFGKYWWYIGAPVHTYNFSINSIEKILHENNFRIIHIRYCGNYAGILGSLQIFLNRRNVNLKSTDGILFNNPIFMLLCQFIAIILNKLKSGDAIEVISEPI